METPWISRSLRAARERLGWSRETLAHHSGVSWSAIAQIEAGRRTDVRLSSLSALARALGVTIDHLGGGSAAAPPHLLEHRALVHRSTDEFLATVVPFVREGIDRSDAMLVVAAEPRLESVRESLDGDRKRVEFAGASEWYSSPVDALRRFRGFIDERLAGGATWVRIVGEPFWSDRSEAALHAWTLYEAIINLRLAAAPVTLICSYHTPSVPGRVMRAVGCTHPEYAQPGTAVASGSYREPEDYLLGGS
jgi:transcriptional regulator with XRE-family HTH domain